MLEIFKITLKKTEIDVNDDIIRLKSAKIPSGFRVIPFLVAGFCVSLSVYQSVCLSVRPQRFFGTGRG